MKSIQYLRPFALTVLFLAGFSAPAEPKREYGKIEVIQDTWGIPHVFSDTDAGAMYGLGYAAAEQRGFQMTYNLRIIQGRLAEIVGERQRGNRNETAVDHDRKMRTFGWARAATRTAANLDRATRELLHAYCQGVNDSFAGQAAAGRVKHIRPTGIGLVDGSQTTFYAAGPLHPLFKKLEVMPGAVDTSGLSVELVASGTILRYRWYARSHGVAESGESATRPAATTKTQSSVARRCDGGRAAERR